MAACRVTGNWRLVLSLFKLLFKTDQFIFVFFKVEREITENVLSLIRTTGDFIHQGREVQVMSVHGFRFRSELYEHDQSPIAIVRLHYRMSIFRALRN